MRIFVAGMMPGTRRGAALREQDVGSVLTEGRACSFPEVDIDDPLADHGRSLDLETDPARVVFLQHNELW